MRKYTVFLLLTAFFVIVSSAHIACSESTVPAKKEMSIGQAIVLGIVEGVTEYLPVSSTGHLLLAEKIMGIGENKTLSASEQERDKEAVDAYTICIQAGAIIAVLGLYFRRVLQMLQGLLGRSPEGLRLFINVAVGFLPAAVIGLLFNKIIKAYLFGPWPVVIAWLVGGLAILAVSFRRQRSTRIQQTVGTLDGLHWKMALIIGFAQCIAMWPGVSRSLVTIVGGVLVGLSLPAAVEYSFLLGVVTLGAATAYDALKHGQIMVQTFDAQSLAIGVFFAFIAAVVSVKWMVSYLNRHGLAIFGYYRVALALITAVLLATNVI
ncbi:undecaprenyl-diphosphate phosphatase [Desulfopila sp. IMCC35006]|uniref:undecaprenyl-diphosphate phosphatase n=1 Tax=Desulfopila sp. IMCC35006 TaxID=2569542 RepID=UPI0010AD6FA0|nr:undecaprenyl-diphosphate phosphatase [Desulfopila sp. IMCC35006]TKB28236.1 undecaprenyl-diphosphate phosphatase [Desulfopila sp. IMCC35006]